MPVTLLPYAVREMAEAIRTRRLIQVNDASITPVSYDAFITARKQAFTTRNILSGWSGTGLHPFNPQKVLGRVPVPPPVETPPREPTPIFINPTSDHGLGSVYIETLSNPRILRAT